MSRSKGATRPRARRFSALRADVSCVRCHTAEGKGGVVGPVLDGVGQRQTRQYILESIVDPNAKIAPGFESAVVKTKSGGTHVGVVRKEDAHYLVLIDGDGKQESIDKREIISRERGLVRHAAGYRQDAEQT